MPNNPPERLGIRPNRLTGNNLATINTSHINGIKNNSGSRLFIADHSNSVSIEPIIPAKGSARAEIGLVTNLELKTD